MNELGLWLKKVRKEHGITQKELAALCGWTSYQRVSQMETGYRNPKASSLEKIAHAYGMEYHDFWKLYIDEQKKNNAPDDECDSSSHSDILREILKELKEIRKILGE